jgi:hypothetical protein
MAAAILRKERRVIVDMSAYPSRILREFEFEGIDVGMQRWGLGNQPTWQEIYHDFLKGQSDWWMPSKLEKGSKSPSKPIKW